MRLQICLPSCQTTTRGKTSVINRLRLIYPDYYFEVGTRIVIVS